MKELNCHNHKKYIFLHKFKYISIVTVSFQNIYKVFEFNQN